MQKANQKEKHLQTHLCILFIVAGQYFLIDICKIIDIPLSPLISI